MTAFPGAEASFTGFTASHTLAADSHASQHNLEQSEVVATQHKIGTGSSTPTSGLVLRGNGVGTSSWSPVILTSDVSGVLPVANGGTGIASFGAGVATFLGTPNSANLLAAVTDETGSGALVFGTSPTLLTPIIASFASSTHNHQNPAGGGTLAPQAVPALDLSLQTLSLPYKFSVYRAAGQNVGTAATKVNFETEEVDTNNNYDSVTNFRYTVPVSGYYQINFTVALTSAGTGTNISVYLYKNGSPIWQQNVDASAGFSPGVTHAKLWSLAAADYLEVFIATGVAAKALDVSATYNNSFSGNLVSQT